MKQFLILVLLSMLLSACTGAAPAAPEIPPTPAATRDPDPDGDGFTGEGKGTNAAAGAQLAKTNGCLACHAADGSKLVGPSFKGLYGSPVELSDGTTVIADDVYIVRAIIDPNMQVVAGYAPTMAGYGHLSDEEIGHLLAYVKSLK